MILFAKKQNKIVCGKKSRKQDFGNLVCDWTVLNQNSQKLASAERPIGGRSTTIVLHNYLPWGVYLDSY